MRKQHILFACVLLTFGASALAAPPKVVLKTDTRTKGSEYKITVTRPTFQGSGPLVAFANQNVAGPLDAALRDFAGQAAHVSHSPGPLEFTAQPTIKVLRDDMITGYYTVYMYMGGAHGTTQFAPFNYVLYYNRPRSITLTEVFEKGFPLEDELNKSLFQHLLEDTKATYVQDGSVTSLPSILTTPCVLEDDGIRFLIAPYVVAPGSEGAFDVKLRFLEIYAKRSRALPPQRLRG